MEAGDMRKGHMRSWLQQGIVAVAVAAVGTPVLHAQQTDRKAEDILANARKAIGNKKLESLSTFSLEGVIQRNLGERQLSSDVELLLGLPDKYVRTDTPSGMGNSMSSGFNGDKVIRPAGMTMMPGGGAMVVRMGGGGGPASFGGAPPEKLTPEQQAEADKAMLRSSRNDVSRLMLGWFAMTHPAVNAQYKLAGEAESPDGKAWVIDVANGDGFSARLFIDQQTNLPLMVNYQGPQARVMTMGAPRPAGGASTASSGGQARQVTDEERKKMREDAEKQIQQMQREAPVMVDYTLFFEDWQQSDGVMFPHKLRRASGGATNEEWTVNKVKVNPKIDAKKFSTEN
jgi:hypothetical protein